MFPYLDVLSLKLRAIIPASYIDAVESSSAGFVEQSIEDWSSYINTRLRKRYGRASQGNSLPWGQVPPTLVAQGTAPPSVTLTGVPTLGSMKVWVQITTGGALGAALFQWSSNGGVTWTATGVATAASVVLTGTGLTAVFPVGAYGTDNFYKAAPPVPAAILKWLTALVTVDVWDKRGADPSDPEMVRAQGRKDQAIAEIKEAADSKDGLFDLPVSEDQDTAVTTGAPLGYSEQSPWVWTDIQANNGTQQDRTGSGS